MTEQRTVVLVTPTIQDGTVVRWYRSDASAKGGNEFMSASRNGVLVHVFLHTVSEDLLAQADEVHRILRDSGPDERVYALATHRHQGLLSDTLIPVDRAGSQEADDA
jgi:hypothetical protein